MAHVVDYATFLLLTGAGLAVGCYFTFRKKASQARVEEIFLGSKSLMVIPLAASSLATAASATGVVGVPAHMYAYGFHLAWALLFHIAMVPVAIKVVVPVLYQLNLTSVFQYVRMRYNTPISVVTSVTYIILSQMVGAIAIFASSVAVSTVFSASAIWCSVIIGLTSTAYTAMGGLRGVVWADCLQAVLTISAPVVIVAKVMWDAKSGDTRIQPLSEILTYKYFYNYSFDLTTDETIWAGLLATTPTFFNRICLDQGTAQRYFASRNQKEAKWTVIAGTLMTCVFYGLLACAGAALVCSTLSSLVNSQAAVWYFDVITPFCKVRDTQVDLIVKALGAIMKTSSTAIFCVISMCAVVVTVGQAHPAVIVGGGSYGCNCPALNVLAARQCCTTVGSCCLRAGMGFGAYGGHLGGHLGGVGFGAGYPVASYGSLGLGMRRPMLMPPRFAHGGVQLNIGAGLG
ncbi:hypothetical protein MRX96_059751 [Rhipicephalus microplus]